jgi:hypothetical protein
MTVESLAAARTRRFARSAGVEADQLRACDVCGVLAVAVDGYQRAQLDAVGFAVGCCPDCRPDSGSNRVA